MALHAGDSRVPGGAEFRGLDEERHRLASALELKTWIPMASEAVAIGHALGIENAADLVRLMAVNTGRYDVGLFLPKLAPDYFLMDGFNLGIKLVFSPKDDLGAAQELWARLDASAADIAAASAIITMIVSSTSG